MLKDCELKYIVLSQYHKVKFNLHLSASKMYHYPKVGWLYYMNKKVVEFVVVFKDDYYVNLTRHSI